MKTEFPRSINERGYLTMPKTFVDRHWIYEEMFRDGLFVIYRKRKEDWKCWKYEAMKIKENPAYSLGGVLIEAREAMASNEEFGVNAFAADSYEEAVKRLNQIKNPEVRAALPKEVVVKRGRGRPKKIK